MRLLIRLLLNLAVAWLALRRLLATLGLAESSILWTTSTTGDGASKYTEAQSTAHWGDWFTPNSTITNPHASQGVIAGAGGELAVTGTSSPVAVASGAAIVEGYPYRSTASTNVTISTPGGATRIDRIVLRVSHSTTRTVRITRIAGTEGAGVPALTQTAGTTWDIPLAQCSITIGGVITVTDERTFCYFGTKVKTAMLDNNAADNTKIRDSAALSVIGRASNSSGDPADIAAATDSHVLALNGTTLGFNSVIVPLGWQRQGGSATNWSSAGTSTQTDTTYRQEGGAITLTFSGTAQTATATITFPTAFGNVPLPYVTGQYDTSQSDGVEYVGVSSISATQLAIIARRTLHTTTATLQVYWLAKGPR